jgi:hypothetical protein
MDIQQIALVALLSVSACVADPGEEADALSATDGRNVSASVTLDDDGTSPEMQAYEQIYGMVRSGCERPGARIVRITVPWEKAPVDVHCADVANKGERGIVGALLGLAAYGVAYAAEGEHSQDEPLAQDNSPPSELACEGPLDQGKRIKKILQNRVDGNVDHCELR